MYVQHTYVCTSMYSYTIQMKHRMMSSATSISITFEDLYRSLVFLAALWIAGRLVQRLLAWPPLTGEIVAGMVLGPSLLDIVPLQQTWVLLGEIGYVHLYF